MSDQMPPLGPPYGPSGPPPPPRFPAHPPTEWAPRPLEPVPGPPLPPPPDRRRALVLAGIVAAAVLLIGAVAFAMGGDSSTKAAPPRRTTTTTAPASDSTDSAASTDSTDSTDSSSSPSAAELQQVVDDIKKFVEKERGLTFTADVPVALLDDAAFNQELLADFESSQASIDEESQVLKSLGLVTSNRDITADLKQLLGAGVLGFYDQKAKRLAVKGTDTSPFVRKVLAHELTHALDDQHFNLDRPALDTADDETSFGFSALVEGNARTVETAYYDKVLSADEQAQSDAEEASIAASNPQIYTLPQVLLALLNAPYQAGEPLVAAIRDAGGQARLDAAFAAPPITSEDAFEPDKFLAGEGPVAVPDPTTQSGQPVANTGVLGVLYLQELLDDGGFFGTDIDSALKGWGGDRYVTWVDGDRTCIQDVVVGGDAKSTGALLQRFEDWASAPGISATVSPLSSDPSSPFAITSCSL
jgi:hypothetical protein